MYTKGYSFFSLPDLFAMNADSPNVTENAVGDHKDGSATGCRSENMEFQYNSDGACPLANGDTLEQDKRMEFDESIPGRCQY